MLSSCSNAAAQTFAGIALGSFTQCESVAYVREQGRDAFYPCKNKSVKDCFPSFLTSGSTCLSSINSSTALLRGATPHAGEEVAVSDWDLVAAAKQYMAEYGPETLGVIGVLVFLTQFRKVLQLVDLALPEQYQMGKRWDAYKEYRFPDWKKLEQHIYDPNPQTAKNAAATLAGIILSDACIHGRDTAAAILRKARLSDLSNSRSIEEGLDDAVKKSGVIERWKSPLPQDQKLQYISKLAAVGGPQALMLLTKGLADETDRTIQAHITLALHRCMMSEKHHAHAALLDHDLSAARKVLADVSDDLSLQPKNADLLQVRADAYRRLGSYAKAEEDYALADSLLREERSGQHDKIAKNMMERAIAWWEQGKKEEAVQNLQEAVRYDPKLPEAWLMLGTIYDHSGNSAAAASAYNQVLILFEEVIPGLNTRLGDLYLKQGDYRLAIMMYESALRELVEGEKENNKEGIRIQSNLSCAYEAIGSTREAIEHLEAVSAAVQALHEEELSADDLIVVGLISYSLGDIEKALEYYKLAKEKAEKSDDRIVRAYALQWIARLHLIQHDSDFDYILRSLDESIALLGCGSGVGLLAEVLMVKGKVVGIDQGRYEDAVSILEKALRIAAESRDLELQSAIYSLMGLMQKDHGDPDVAFANLTTAIDLLQGRDVNSLFSTAHLGLALLYRDRGEMKKAVSCYEAAIKSQRKRMQAGLYFYEYPDMRAAYWDLLNIHLRQHDDENALLVLQEAVQAAAQMKDHDSLAYYYNLMGGVYDHRGNIEQALFYWELAWENSSGQDREGLFMQSQIRNNEGYALLKKGLWVRAIERLEEAVELGERSMSDNSWGRIYANMGLAYAGLAKHIRKTRTAVERSALQRFTQEGSSRRVTEGDVEQTIVSSFDRAMLNFEKALSFYIQKRNIKAQASVQVDMGDLFVDGGQYERALAAYEVALNIYQLAGSSESLMRVFIKMGEAYTAFGDKEKARECQQKARDVFSVSRAG